MRSDSKIRATDQNQHSKEPSQPNTYKPDRRTNKTVG